jgi:hypothetical protein
LSTATRARKAFDANRVSGAVKRLLGGDSKDAKLFVAWLADACHATENVARGTLEDTYRAIGRREVWLLLQDAMRLTEEDIRDLQEQVGGWDQA